MIELAPFFNTYRMVQQYTEEMYMPRFECAQDMSQPNFDKGIEFAAWRENLNRVWHEIEILQVDVDSQDVEIGSKTDITAKVKLGSLKPDDVRVQLYYGMLDTMGKITDGQAVDMDLSDDHGDGVYTYKTTYTYTTTGNVGFSVRIVPQHKYIYTPFLP
ncbi:MAG: hypothetical protein CUN57_01200, partial [Phototrophicales bacterium]